MTKVFLGGPLRNKSDIEYLGLIESSLLPCDFDIFVPPKRIGVLPKKATNLRPLEQNLLALKDCDIAIFVVEQERTGTGIELGYLCSLKESGESGARLFGICRPEYADDVDLMARYCLERFGQLVCSVDELIRAIRFEG